MDTVGQRLKILREMRGYTQKQLAEKASVHEMTIQFYEYETRKPKQEQLEKLAQALEVDPAFLQPAKTNTPFAIYALLYDIIQAYGDISLKKEGERIYIGISNGTDKYVSNKLWDALLAHEKLSFEDFMKWLIDQPKLLHDGEFIEKGNNP